MTDTPPETEPVAPPEDAASAEAAPPRKRRDPLPLLFGIGVVVLVGAVVFLWRHPLDFHPHHPRPAAPASTAQTAGPRVAAAIAPPAAPAPIAPPARTAAPAQPPLGTQLADLEKQVQNLQQQVESLAQKQPPAAPDLQPLEARVTALENRPAGAAPDLKPLSDRVAAIEQKLATPAPDPAIEALRTRLDALAAEQSQLAAHQANEEEALTKRLDAEEAAIKQVQQSAVQISALSDRAARIARIQAAAAALDAGQPLGDVPGAPPALARFRDQAPPTEASLRLAFPNAAAAAEAASRPDTARLPFWQAVKARAETLVTVRRGDDVIVGDPAAGIIARARTALDAGDLAGAVAAVDTLNGPAAAALAAWRGRAQALLDARAALAAMAAHA